MAGEPVLVTGAAGFIGFCLARRLLERGRAVVGVDNVNSYCDPALKEAWLAVLRQFPNFTFHRLNLADRKLTADMFHDGDFGSVVHLAAQAGVRCSLENPHAYLDANISGFLNILEGCRYRKTAHLVYASSSSVYGANTTLPFSVHHNVDHPISLYAATKKANELMAHAYSHLYALPATGLRFFTVYGPWGRPDMAMYLFAKAIPEGQPIKLFNNGRMRRNLTYVDDAVEAIERLIGRPPTRTAAVPGDDLDPAKSAAPWRVYNIGNSTAVEIYRLRRMLTCKRMSASAVCCTNWWRRPANASFSTALMASDRRWRSKRRRLLVSRPPVTSRVASQPGRTPMDRWDGDANKFH
jgi:UDP-glucuronate 4-epimerase